MSCHCASFVPICAPKASHGAIAPHLRPKSQPWRDCAPFAPQEEESAFQDGVLP